MKKSNERKPPAPQAVRQAKAEKGIHAKCVFQQLGNDSGKILKPVKN